VVAKVESEEDPIQTTRMDEDNTEPNRMALGMDYFDQ
jgi:hypothetical protein